MCEIVGVPRLSSLHGGKPPHRVALLRLHCSEASNCSIQFLAS